MAKVDESADSATITICSADLSLTGELLTCLANFVRHHPLKDACAVEVVSGLKNTTQKTTVDAENNSKIVRNTIEEWVRLCGFKTWRDASQRSNIKRASLYEWVKRGRITPHGMRKLYGSSTTEEARKFLSGLQNRH